jgi:hypothetical protein
MELQFYGPGYVPQFTGFGCAAHVCCAATTIDSASENLNTGAVNTAACNNFVLGGIEPINSAYITKSAQFYPFYSTTVRNGSCTWHEGGKFLPNTTNDFGGSSTSEFGPLLKTLVPDHRIQDGGAHRQLQQQGHAEPLPSDVSTVK